MITDEECTKTELTNRCSFAVILMYRGVPNKTPQANKLLITKNNYRKLYQTTQEN